MDFVVSTSRGTFLTGIVFLEFYFLGIEIGRNAMNSRLRLWFTSEALCRRIHPKLLRIAVGLAVIAAGVFIGSKLVASDYDPQTLLPRQPTILNENSRPAAEIGNKVDPTELVIGVTVGGVSRAYPINMLNGPSREIINDELGKMPIAATW